MEIRQWPSGPVIATLRVGDELIVLHGMDTQDGLVWIQVQDDDGRVGWIPQVYILTKTPTITHTVTATLTQTPSSPTVENTTLTLTPSSPTLEESALTLTPTP